MSASSVKEALSSISITGRAINFPDEICLASENEKITTFEFNQFVNSFAQTLSQIPKSPTFLPILLGANINSVIAYHAAIRSRTPFALIDSNTNPEYLKSILIRLKNPRYLINTTDKKIDISSVEQVFVEREKANSFVVPIVDLGASASVLFTSGSTGEPKGVVWDWNIFDDLFKWRLEFIKPEVNSLKWGMFSSLAFTAGASQAMLAATGHQLYVLNANNSSDKIINFVNEKEIINLAFGTSFGERLFDTRSQSLSFQTVRTITIYGESVSWGQIEKLRKMANNKAEIYCVYGSSEAPGSFIQHKIAINDSLGLGRPPIASLINYPSLEFSQLGDDSELLELVLTRGLAKEYLENKDLTQKKFHNEKGKNLKYFSGDLVHCDSDGLISFAGRRDDLVKINGRLVDPSESVGVLRMIPGIQTLEVIPHVNLDGKVTLVAHLVLEVGSSLTPSKIFTILLDKLSSHLVPTKLVKHDAIPLTENGKIDRQYLLNNTWPRWKDNEGSTDLNIFEKFALSQLQKILDKPDLTPTEDIFGAGMDSLAAVEFDVSASAFGYSKIEPSIFLTHRNAKALGRFIADGGAEKENNVIELNKNGLNPPIFLFPGAGVTAIFYDKVSQAMGQNQPLVIIEPIGLHGKREFHMTIEEMAFSASEHINETYPNGKIQILGHSAGSVIGCVVGENLYKKGRDVKLISLDAVHLVNQVSMSKNKYAVISFLNRVQDLMTRNPRSLKQSFRRRLKAQDRSSYEFFTLHIGGLTLKHKIKERPKFNIHILYCKENQYFKDWKRNELLTYERVDGTHSTLLDNEYLPVIVPKILSFFR